MLHVAEKACWIKIVTHRLFEVALYSIEKIDHNILRFVVVMKIDVTGIDWTSPDVRKVVEFFSKRFDAIEKENSQIKDENAQLYEKIKGAFRIRKARDDVPIISAITTSENTNSIHVQNPHACAQQSHNNFPIINKTADQRYCPQCGEQLSDWNEEHIRHTEDLVDGAWCFV